ncbi:50S ribosomal protein L1 [Mannheimia haemolytica]|uniref:50S ribosomal protein L1 n=1 Tax=Mannheimia haemolytica TaxID=75985 RepID=A0A378MTB7_MANHA|nr:50S ribosomal protein L1 [Mannheimia haemolytica]
MAKLTKKMKAIKAGVDSTKAYDINEAVEVLKKFATAKFVESVDVAVNLGIDRVNQTKTCVVQLYFHTVQAVQLVLLCLHKVQTQKQQKQRVLT